MQCKAVDCVHTTRMANILDICGPQCATQCIFRELIWYHWDDPRLLTHNYGCFREELVTYEEAAKTVDDQVLTGIAQPCLTPSSAFTVISDHRCTLDWQGAPNASGRRRGAMRPRPRAQGQQPESASKEHSDTRNIPELQGDAKMRLPAGSWGAW
ncbi:uncharacterized protein B0H18DRAFT_1102968 [Fomitopsis serialis]|uniref:uncharacterized protein n=1 Tax=Fomitopsis serialis TaxID=139415 RepID=UPI002008C6BC|nr:uncharacterized protein B0H18DRAFT_1102968 [Neoantrodia serialis]KAH9930612.1 hypothetical protein B0H18DRAFT_1102968 [Neoantrodia serialis]